MNDNTNPEPTNLVNATPDPEAVEAALSVFPETEAPADLGYVETVPAMDGHYDQPEGAYRYLNWLNTHQSKAARGVDLDGFSIERQQGINDLIRNGLVCERLGTGINDGLRTLVITELGYERLEAAWAVAALTVIG